MTQHRKVINEYRLHQNEEILESYRYLHNNKEGYYESDDLNYHNRKELILELYEDFSEADKGLVKWLLKEEIKGDEVSLPEYTRDICAYMIYKFMDMNDVHNLFEAKFGGGYNRMIMDVELVFGYDREQTKEYLRAQKKNKRLNKIALEIIEEYESEPGNIFRDREQYIHYFETNKINKLRNDLKSIED